MKIISQAYKDLCQVITDNVTEVAFKDLWHNQINFLDDEYPFPFPCLFLEFIGDSIEQTGAQTESIGTTINVFIGYETLADSYEGSSNQESALEFLELMDKVNVALQLAEMDSFAKLKFQNFTPIEAPGSIILYRMTYKTEIVSTSVADEEATTPLMVSYTLQEGEKPYVQDDTFDIDMNG